LDRFDRAGLRATLGALPSFPGKRIWVTNSAFVPGSMSPDQKCQSERPLGVTAGVALLAYTDRPASAVLDLAASYVQPDGQLVGTGAELLAVGAGTGEQVNLVRFWQAFTTGDGCTLPWALYCVEP
jgi:hypothetical protein